MCNSKKSKRIFDAPGFWAYVCQLTGLESIELSNLIYQETKILIFSKIVEKEDGFFS